MVGGILQLVGLIALLCGACELAAKGLRWLDGRRWRGRVRERLIDDQRPADVTCPWPRLEPEVERLRERGAL